MHGSMAQTGSFFLKLEELAGTASVQVGRCGAIVLRAITVTSVFEKEIFAFAPFMSVQLFHRSSTLVRGVLPPRPAVPLGVHRNITGAALSLDGVVRRACCGQKPSGQRVCCGQVVRVTS